MSGRRGGVAVRSYGAVVDKVERRIFRVDRWRLPTPHGVSLRAIGYALASLAVIALASSAPIVGDALSLIPASARYLAIPAVCGWALASAQIDGRPPHHAIWAGARQRLSARTVAGLRAAPAVGTELAPVACVQIAPAGDEPAYRSGRVRGPATLTLRYPAELALERVGARAGADPAARLAAAKRVRVRGLRGRPLVSGQQLQIPDGADVVFE